MNGDPTVAVRSRLGQIAGDFQSTVHPEQVLGLRLGTRRCRRLLRELRVFLRSNAVIATVRQMMTPHGTISLAA